MILQGGIPVIVQSCLKGSRPLASFSGFESYRKSLTGRVRVKRLRPDGQVVVKIPAQRVPTRLYRDTCLKRGLLLVCQYAILVYQLLRGLRVIGRKSVKLLPLVTRTLTVSTDYMDQKRLRLTKGEAGQFPPSTYP